MNRLCGILFSVLFLLAPAHAAKNLKVVFGVYRPPYVYDMKNEGLDFEITMAALAKKDYKITAMHSPNQRAHQEILQKKVDGVIGVPKEGSGSLCYTEPILFYDNVAISKAKDKVVLNKVGDLKEYNFLAFSDAHRYLGSEYAELVKGMKRDTDIANQQTQVKLFWNGKVQVVVLDLNIFRHYQKTLGKEMKSTDEVVIHRLFPNESNARVAAFRDSKVCDDFNQGLREIKADGTFQKILDKYLKIESI